MENLKLEISEDLCETLGWKQSKHLQIEIDKNRLILTEDNDPLLADELAQYPGVAKYLANYKQKASPLEKWVMGKFLTDQDHKRNILTLLHFRYNWRDLSVLYEVCEEIDYPAFFAEFKMEILEFSSSFAQDSVEIDFMVMGIERIALGDPVELHESMSTWAIGASMKRIAESMLFNFGY